MKAGRYVYEGIKKAHNEKKGNVAEINLLLTVMLREAGLDANPVLLSTRKNGRIREMYPIVSKFNYVISHVNIEGKDILLDATEMHLAVGELPERCLNGRGRLINKTNSRWIDLRSREKFIKFVQAQFQLGLEGTLIGTVQNSKSGMEGLNARKAILKKGKGDYIKSFKEKNEELGIEDHTIENLNILGKPIKEVYSVSMEQEVLGNLIYFNPMIIERQTENPFKNDQRDYPVDFSCPISETVMQTIILPQGFVVDEKPQNAIFRLPDKGGQYVYSISQTEQQLQLVSRLNINKTIFSPAEYGQLRELFNQIVAKQSEQVVLKQQ